MICSNCGTEIQDDARFCKNCGCKVEAVALAEPKQPDMPTIQSAWPEWQIVDKPLGKGSYGVVYKAVRRDHNVESYSAIKVITIPTDSAELDSLRSEGFDENASRTYLEGIVNDCVSEIQLMVSLKGGQNIVNVEDYKVIEKSSEIGWQIYIRMELLIPFNSYICDKKMTEEDVIKLGCDICSALEICEKRNIIHRDIKPENIFLNDFGAFKLGDFGIARKMENMTGGLSQKGTYNYMAPEVATSGEYDARVDTYSLGIVLYRLLNANRLPLLETDKQLLNATERRNAVDRRIRGEALPVPCEASPAMAEVILRACAYNPDDRFASATEMKQALLRVAADTYPQLDKTVSVRKAAVVDYDKTVSVRKAPADPEQRGEKVVKKFGEEPKKSKLPLILGVIAAALALLLLVGAASYFLLNRDNEKDKTTTSDGSQETSPQSGPAAPQTDVLGINNTQYRINMFLTNFSETRFYAFPCSDYELLRFVREHCYYNDDGDITTRNGREYIDQETVNEVLYKYFAFTLTENAPSKDYYSDDGSRSIRYGNQKYSYLLSPYEYNGYVAIARSMYQDSYGHYNLTYDVYYVDPNYKSERTELYYLTSEEAKTHARLTYAYSGEAVVQDYLRTNGKQSYQLITLKATQP